MSLDKEVNEYASKTARSRTLHEEAVAVMPGGNSRTTTFFDPYPFYFQRGQGAQPLFLTLLNRGMEGAFAHVREVALKLLLRGVETRRGRPQVWVCTLGHGLLFPSFSCNAK